MLPVFRPNTSYNYAQMCTFLWTFCHQIFLRNCQQYSMKLGHSTTKILYSFVKGWVVVHTKTPIPYSPMEIMIYNYQKIYGNLRKSKSFPCVSGNPVSAVTPESISWSFTIPPRSRNQSTSWPHLRRTNFCPYTIVNINI